MELGNFNWMKNTCVDEKIIVIPSKFISYAHNFMSVLLHVFCDLNSSKFVHSFVISVWCKKGMTKHDLAQHWIFVCPELSFLSRLIIRKMYKPVIHRIVFHLFVFVAFLSITLTHTDAHAHTHRLLYPQEIYL